MTHDPVITEAIRKQARKLLQKHAQSPLNRVTHMCAEDAVDAVAEALAMHRANPVVDVEGMVELVRKALSGALRKKCSTLWPIASGAQSKPLTPKVMCDEQHRH